MNERKMNDQVVVSEIVLDGNRRTKLSFFQHVLKDHDIESFSKQEYKLLSKSTATNNSSNNRNSSNNGVSFEKLRSSLQRVDQQLRESQLFEDVDIQIQPVVSANGPSATVSGAQKLRVHINVKEKQILHVGVETFAETNQNIGAQVYGGLRNPLGQGERFIFAAKTNQQLDQHQDYSLQASFPFLGHRLGALTLSLRKHQDNQTTYYSSYDGHFFTLLADFVPAINKNYCTTPNITNNNTTTTTATTNGDSVYDLFRGKNAMSRWSLEISHRHEVPFAMDTNNDTLSLPSNGDHRSSSSSTNSNSNMSASTTSSSEKIVRRTQPVGFGFLQDEILRYPSNVILNSVAQSWKTSLKYYQLCSDSRDSNVNPTSGHFLETAVEVAVPPGDALFVKTEVAGQVHVPFSDLKAWYQHYWMQQGTTETLSGKNKNSVKSNTNTTTSTTKQQQKQQELVLSVAASVGLMYPLTSFFQSLLHTPNTLHKQHNNEFNISTDTNSNNNTSTDANTSKMKDMQQKRSYLSDRYHMGGPLQLRGFRNAGIGPRAFSPWSDDSVGGDSRRNVLVMLSYPLLQCFPPSGAGTNKEDRDENKYHNYYYFFSKQDATSTNTSTNAVSQFVSRLSQQSVSLARDTDMRVFVFGQAGSIGSPSYWTYHNTKNTNNSVANNTNNTNNAQNLQNPHPLFGFLRMSVGGGLSVIIAQKLRLEATYSVPVVYGVHTDHVKPFQLGINVQYQ